MKQCGCCQRAQLIGRCGNSGQSAQRWRYGIDSVEAADHHVFRNPFAHGFQRIHNLAGQEIIGAEYQLGERAHFRKPFGKPLRLGVIKIVVEKTVGGIYTAFVTHHQKCLIPLPEGNAVIGVAHKTDAGQVVIANQRGQHLTAAVPAVHQQQIGIQTQVRKSHAGIDEGNGLAQRGQHAAIFRME